MIRIFHIITILIISVSCAEQRLNDNSYTLLDGKKFSLEELSDTICFGLSTFTPFYNFSFKDKNEMEIRFMRKLEKKYSWDMLKGLDIKSFQKNQEKLAIKYDDLWTKKGLDNIMIEVWLEEHFKKMDSIIELEFNTPKFEQALIYFCGTKFSEENRSNLSRFPFTAKDIATYMTSIILPELGPRGFIETVEDPKKGAAYGKRFAEWFKNGKKEPNLEYYVFTDGKRMNKKDWITPATIRKFSSYIGSEQGANDFADCFMTKLSKKVKYSDIQPMMGDSATVTLEELKELIKDFYGLSLEEISKDCAEEIIKYMNTDQKVYFKSDREKEAFYTSIKEELNKSKDFKALLPMIDETIIYKCLGDEIIAQFSAKDILSGKAYNSKKYQKILENCLSKSIK